MYLSMGQIFLNRTSTHKTTSLFFYLFFLFSESLDLPLTVDQYLQMSHEQQEKLFPSVELLPGKEPQNRFFYRKQVLSYPLFVNERKFSNKSNTTYVKYCVYIA